MTNAIVGRRAFRLLALTGTLVLISVPLGSTPSAPSSASAIRDPELAPLRAETAATGSEFLPGTSAFRLRVGGFTVSHTVMAVTTLPGEELTVLPELPSLEGVSLHHGGGSVRVLPGGWGWRAPAEPGVQALRVQDASGRYVHLNVLVLHPRSRVRDGILNGFRIGKYLDRPLRGNPAYEPPRGFVEVDSDARGILVSPHFTLGQFLCKQPGEPAYLALSPPLVRKLEALLEAVNREGFRAPTLHVMSGFRTPWYNRAIGNKTVYSRHLWGDAADVFVDADGDGEMDDLNGDGIVNVDDGRVLYQIAESLSGRAGVRPGGLSVYRRNAAHGPFLHVDARGTRARW